MAVGAAAFIGIPGTLIRVFSQDADVLAIGYGRISLRSRCCGRLSACCRCSGCLRSWDWTIIHGTLFP